jgi:NAD(P)-dependent dehydrogenase (short-subunit alcohol dehydrogenase family)
MSRLSGQRALVTGATGGLGAAVARAFVTEGARVGLVARDGTRLAALRAELGEPVTAVAADVASWTDVSRAVSEAARILGGLETVVNAAAVDTVWKPVGELPIDEWDRAIAVNLSGTFYVCRAALPLLSARGGSIINVTSVAGVRAWAEDAAYNASKAGVELLTRTIAVEYGPRGVRANCLAPGVIDAGMTDLVTPDDRAALVAKHPLGRLGRADEVAEAAVWLASDASSFTTGATLSVDGGFLA